MPGLLRGVARTAVVAGTATAVSNRVSRRQADRWSRQGYYDEPEPPPPPAPAAAPAQDPIEQLKQLAALKDQRILTTRSSPLRRPRSWAPDQGTSALSDHGAADRAEQRRVRSRPARALRSPTREHHPAPPACTLAAAVAHRRTSRHAIFEVRPSRGARPPSNRQRGARHPHHAPPRPAALASAAQRPVVAAGTPAAAESWLISSGAGCRSGCAGSSSATIRPTSASAARTIIATT
jgi:hypothetical protein